MSRLANSTLALALALWAVPASAGEVDLALSAHVSPSGPYRPGQSVQLALTVTNLGPDVAGQDVLSDLIQPVQLSSIVSVDEANRLPLLVQPLDPIACPIEYIPFDPPPGMREGIINVVYLPRLLVGEARTCILLVEIDEMQIESPSMTWHASSLLDVDPNAANSSQGVAFPFQPRTIPSMSPFAFALLIAATVMLALRALRR